MVEHIVNASAPRGRVEWRWSPAAAGGRSSRVRAGAGSLVLSKFLRWVDSLRLGYPRQPRPLRWSASGAPVLAGGRDPTRSPRPSPSRTPQSDQEPTPYIWPSIAGSDARDNAPGSECPRPDLPAYTLSNAAACVDELGTEASQPCPFAGSFAGTKTLLLEFQLP